MAELFLIQSQGRLPILTLDDVVLGKLDIVYQLAGS
jgi:hypothetical protein